MTGARKILVVDDSSDNREGICALLRFMGLDVREACSAEDALKIAADFKPELFLLDIKMPGMSGLQLLEKLDVAGGDCAAIMMTGHESVDDACRALELGASGYLRKPVRFEELSKQIGIAFRKIDEHASAEQLKVNLEREAIHHSRKAEESYRIVESQSRRFDLILDNMQEPLLAIDSEKRIMMVNKAAERAFGINAGEVIDRTFADAFSDSALARIIDQVEISFKTDGTPPQKNHIECCGRIYSVSVSRLIHDVESMAGYVMIFTDKTSHYQAEQLRTAFLSVVSHEFRTPLSVLLNVGALLGTKQHCSDEIELAKTHIEDACSRLTHLVNSVVTFARIAKADTVLSVNIVDINEFLRRSVGKFDDAAGKKRVTVNYAAAEGGSKTVIDEELLSCAMESILDNAVKYSPEGGTVDVRHQFVLHGNKKQHRIVIEDGGPGIPPEKIVSVFELFFQGEDPLRRTYGGLGFGLPLAKRAVELLGGEILIGTGVRGGCRVEIRVPMR